jgi:tetratricopeptide (TPR) repeat protein
MLRDSSPCEVTAYVEEKLSSSSSSSPSPFSNGPQCDMERGSYLVAIGNHKEAIRYFEAAHRVLCDARCDPLFERLYFKTCILYAWCLDCIGDFSREEELLLEALPGKGLALGDYAYFLHKRKSDYDLAQRYYKLSLSEYPKQSTVHLRYAGFLRHVRRDNVEAEKHYKLAADSNPKNADAVGNYASFLHGVSRNYDSAEYYYDKAVATDSTHVNNYCNFGLFLSEERKDYIRAEVMLQS